MKVLKETSLAITSLLMLGGLITGMLYSLNWRDTQREKQREYSSWYLQAFHCEHTGYAGRYEKVYTCINGLKREGDIHK